MAASRGHAASKARQRTGGAGSAASAGWVAFVCAAVLLLQMLALAHGIAHPHARAGVAHSIDSAHDEAHDDAQDHAQDHDQRARDGDAAALAGLFDGHHDEGSVQCQLLDQLAHAHALSAPAVDWTFAPPHAEFSAQLLAPQRATVGREYHARGPPSFLA
jgi:hypothetical protein